MVAAAENMQAFGWDLFPATVILFFLAAAALPVTNLIFLLSWYYLVS